jgi:DoxX-like family
MVRSLSVLIGLLFLVTGGMKIFGVKASLRIRDQLRMQPTLWRMIGLLEWAGAIGLILGLAFPALGIAAAAALCLFMLGAAGSRLRVHDKAANVAFDLGVFALVAVDLILQARA